MSNHLLDSMSVARFVDEGFLLFEGVIPEHLCQMAIEETRQMQEADAYVDIRQQPHHFDWQDALVGSAYKSIIDLPQIRGAIESLCGPDPQFDHYRIHRTLPIKSRGFEYFLHFHQDCVLDMRPLSFDVNVSIFPQAVTPEMGGTMFLPGSQYRKLHNANFYRYQHIRGSKQTVCPAGTVAIWHGNLWHSARPNISDSDRIMFLARFNPRVPQVRTWLDDEIDQNAVAQLMLRGHPWIGGEHPLEWINRIRQWRYMSNDYDFDFMGYAKRIHNAFAADDVNTLYRATTRDSIPA